jgi:hypothetical protein
MKSLKSHQVLILSEDNTTEPAFHGSERQCNAWVELNQSKLSDLVLICPKFDDSENDTRYTLDQIKAAPYIAR